MILCGLRKRWSSPSGQSLIETALLVPLFLLLIFNVINIAYYFLIGLHLTSASRAGVQFSVTGPETAGQVEFPPPAAVKDLTELDISSLTGAVTVSVRVCTTTEGLGTTGSGATLRANCQPFGPAATFTDPSPDPEAPLFVLNRVDVQYSINPLIPVSTWFAGFGVIDITTVLPHFHRQVSMRQM